MCTWDPSWGKQQYDHSSDWSLCLWSPCEDNDFADVTLACEDGHSSGCEGWSLSQGQVPLTGAL